MIVSAIAVLLMVARNHVEAIGSRLLRMVFWYLNILVWCFFRGALDFACLCFHYHFWQDFFQPFQVVLYLSFSHSALARTIDSAKLTDDRFEQELFVRINLHINSIYIEAIDSEVDFSNQNGSCSPGEFCLNFYFTVAKWTRSCLQ